MRVLDDRDQPSAVAQVLDETRIGVLHELTGVGRHRPVEAGRSIHRIENREALALADLAVDFTEGGRQVHDAGSVLDGDEVVGDDPRRVVDGKEFERPLVMPSEQVADRHW